MEDERGVMLISTSIRINDNMSSDEKKRAIQSIVKLVDIAILNNEDSCKFGVTFERRFFIHRMKVRRERFFFVFIRRHTGKRNVTADKTRKDRQMTCY